jgi:hypothetical protein
LLAGASCVLCSVLPVWDDTQEEFSGALYRLQLNGKKPLAVGEALMAARRKMAREYTNPLVWAPTTLWGNPWASLASP